MTWAAPKLWNGETVVILGGGPSLTKAQIESAKRFKRIATNNAFLLDLDSEVMCWGDTAWYINNRATFKPHKGLKVTWRHASQYPGLDIKTMLHQKKMPPAISLNPCTIAGSNTGHGAINLAVHFGANRIILLGFDMHYKNGFNWHKNHKEHALIARYNKVFIPQLEMAAKELETMGIEVLNCTPGSALDCFPFANIEEVR
jgi:hypothetical protein